MNKKNHVLTIRVPKDLKERIEKTAEKQGVSMNQFAIYAFAREIAELETTAFFQNQYAGKTNKREILEAFDAVMGKQIPDSKPHQIGTNWIFERELIGSKKLAIIRHIEIKTMCLFFVLSVHFRTPLYQNRTLIELRSGHKFS